MANSNHKHNNSLCQILVKLEVYSVKNHPNKLIPNHNNFNSKIILKDLIKITIIDNSKDPTTTIIMLMAIHKWTIIKIKKKV